ncbi:MAG: hypothetical protein COB99_08435 [Sulfurimonas sp.]|nr:MAG: hypothetical protein COB99_08435 [Sulfurimonas sp.]
MSKNENGEPFLNTGLSHINVAKALVEELKPPIEYLTYNIRRYKVPICLILFYTQADVSTQIKETMRLTDTLKTIKLGNSYFNFVFLLFTEEEDAYSFIKHAEKTTLKNVRNFLYFEKLPPTVHNSYNFINSYLFEIEKQESFF